MRRDVLFREALAEDSEDFGRLMLLSAPRLVPVVFGVNAKGILKALFNHKCNLYSFEHSRFIEINGSSAGMIISYDWKVQRRERLRTGLLLLRYMKLHFLTRLPILFKVSCVLGKVGVNEYYVSNVAVYPEYRGLGLGREMLMRVEDEAKRAGAERIVLDVDANNQDAIRVYNRIGCTPIGKPRRIIIDSETHTFLRMSKGIPTSTKLDAING